MGYDAYVTCNCLREGKVSSPPPYAELVNVDQEGVHLDLPWAGNEDKHRAFDQWLNSGPCPHEDMEYCSERLANIWGMGAFRRLVRDLGHTAYPVLGEYLPTSNGGFLPVEAAPGLQKELEKLCAPGKEVSMVHLRELRTDTLIAEGNADHVHPFIFTAFNKYHFVLSDEGFSVVENRNVGGVDIREEIFLATHFTQMKIKEGEYLLGDADSTRIFLSPTSLHRDLEDGDVEYKFALERSRVGVAEEYAYIIEPLKRLAAAVLETGNPICWC